jgi:hypothetical protein
MREQEPKINVAGFSRNKGKGSKTLKSRLMARDGAVCRAHGHRGQDTRWETGHIVAWLFDGLAGINRPSHDVLTAAGTWQTVPDAQVTNVAAQDAFWTWYHAQVPAATFDDVIVQADELAAIITGYGAAIDSALETVYDLLTLTHHTPDDDEYVGFTLKCSMLIAFGLATPTRADWDSNFVRCMPVSGPAGTVAYRYCAEHDWNVVEVQCQSCNRRNGSTQISKQAALAHIARARYESLQYQGTWVI